MRKYQEVFGLASNFDDKSRIIIFLSYFWWVCSAHATVRNNVDTFAHTAGHATNNIRPSPQSSNTLTMNYLWFGPFHMRVRCVIAGGDAEFVVPASGFQFEVPAHFHAGVPSPASLRPIVAFHPRGSYLHVASVFVMIQTTWPCPLVPVSPLSEP